MNTVKIKINKLGMIGQSDEVELNHLMVFSGESGLGKSYLSLVCHYVFSVLLDDRRISSFFTENGYDYTKLRNEYKDKGTALSFSKSQFEKWLSRDAVMWLGYMINNKDVNGDISITLPKSIPEKIEMSFEEMISGIGGDTGDSSTEVSLMLSLSELTYSVREPKGINDESPFAYLFRYYLIQQIFGDFRALGDSYVFPSSRGTVMTENVEPISGMYAEFKKSIQKSITAKPTRIKTPESLTRLLRRVLDGQIIRKDGNYVYATAGVEMPLSAAAASVKELALFEFLIENSDISKSVIMIDEPEAHLHPLKQRLMADVIAGLIDAGAYIQLTTHSDYFLRRLNELITKSRLFERSEDIGDQRYVELCQELGMDPALRISPSLISGYLLERDQTDNFRSIVIKQDMSNGVPFSSFHDALTESIEMKYRLSEELDHGTD